MSTPYLARLAQNPRWDVANDRSEAAVTFSAHAADFVGRTASTNILHTKMRHEVTLVCFGERGERAELRKRGQVSGRCECHLPHRGGPIPRPKCISFMSYSAASGHPNQQGQRQFRPQTRPRPLPTLSPCSECQECGLLLPQSGTVLRARWGPFLPLIGTRQSYSRPANPLFTAIT